MIKLLPFILFEKYICILALEMAGPGKQHCASCIGTLSFPVVVYSHQRRYFDNTHSRGFVSLHRHHSATKESIQLFETAVDSMMHSESEDISSNYLTAYTNITSNLSLQFVLFRFPKYVFWIGSFLYFVLLLILILFSVLLLIAVSYIWRCVYV